MKENFRPSLDLVLQSEGGWSDYPSDPGGATMQGITMDVYRRYKQRTVTKTELRNITKAEVEEIYHEGYWAPSHCDDLPLGVDYLVFDFAVNAGPGRAAKTLQAALGVSADGLIGPVTMAQVAQADPKRLIDAFSAAKERFYRSLNTFPTFGTGWLNRVRIVKANAEKMMLPSFKDVVGGVVR